MRVTIGIKIFGIALVLLFLMALLGVFSTENIKRIGADVDALARYQLPLAQSVSRIELAVLHHLNLFEEIRLALSQRQPGPGEVDDLLRKYNESSDTVNTEIKNARSILRQGTLHSTSADDRLVLNQMSPFLDRAEVEHSELKTQLDRALSQAAQGKSEIAPIVDAAIEREHEEFTAVLMQVNRMLQQRTLAKAERTDQDQAQILRLNWVITLLVSLAGLLIAFLVTRNLIRPVKDLVRGTSQVETGNLDVHINVTSKDEIGDLAQSFNHMVIELQLKERIKETFGKYMDPRIVEHVIGDPAALNAAGHRRDMTVLFIDIRGFTAISETLPADRLVSFLNEYFEAMSGPVKEHRGVIDKFIGDSIMAFWGPPFTDAKESARLACEAALNQLQTLDTFRAALPKSFPDLPQLTEVNSGIGISTGEVVVGNIGSHSSKSYTLIGDTVNLGSRLEGANKEYGTRLMICERTRQRVHQDFETRELDLLQVVGRTQVVRVFELLGRTGQLDARRLQVRDEFQAGLAAYRLQQWDEATGRFQAALALDPNDSPSRVFAGRVAQFRDNPPRAGWTGVWQLVQK